MPTTRRRTQGATCGAFRTALTLPCALVAVIACGGDEAHTPASDAGSEEHVATRTRTDGAPDATADAGRAGRPDAGAPADSDAGSDGDGESDAAVDASTRTDGAIDATCMLVTLGYQAELVTIAGTPFGLDASVDGGRLATGAMTYDTCVPDTDPFASPNTGKYDHAGRESGAFSFVLDAPTGAATVSLEIVGSTRPLVGIRDLDYFDFDDGGHDVFNDVDRFVSVNGTVAMAAEIRFTIGAGAEDFSDDALPANFPYSGTSKADFACVQPDENCVTFWVSESAHGDSFLMALHMLKQVP